MKIRIGELAQRTRCEVVTIRYYEKKGCCQRLRAAVATSDCMATPTLSACSSFDTAALST